MRFHLPLPFWLVRRIVRRNPWLLSDNGQVTRGRTLSIGPLEIDAATTMELKPKHRARLLAERHRE